MLYVFHLLQIFVVLFFLLMSVFLLHINKSTILVKISAIQTARTIDVQVTNRTKIKVLVLVSDQHNPLILLGSKVERLSCTFTGDMEEYNSSDVVIFKANVFRKDLPYYRPPGQRWVFYGWESSSNSPESNKVHMEKALSSRFVFNYTITYSSTADLHYPYGRCSARDAEQDQVVTEIDQIIKPKNKLVTWMVSNCETSGLRENYVRELIKYVDLDVYGECGTMRCTSNKDCNEALIKYKFYLAFENSLCGEYMTEKLWRSLDIGLVPVVYGGLEAYKSVLPLNSYIDVADFATPKLLAEYLLMLDTNTTLYRGYFMWKYNYSCGRVPRELKGATVCDFLNKASNGKNRTVDVTKIWSAYSARCENPEIFMKSHGVSDVKRRPFKAGRQYNRLIN